ncbi:hypothetical protein [Paraburkholderia sp. UCT2]|uniref:hypothetical protein n=1 Tax=Paraburkholderia sp. UCT2 TaxID=2615208 RepID=UPI00223B7C4E|nr:hypothetical protein [Paraburkholderia sp. UCT2]
MPIILTGARAGSAARRRLAENLLPDPLSKEEALKALNAEIMLRFQEAGIAALSDTTVHGAHCLRVAIRHD